MKNIIKNNLKQRIWLMGCVSLLFILCRPMIQLVTYENEKMWSLTQETLIEAMETFFLPDVFTDYIPTAIACVVIAVVFFGYLFSKRQVDLFHSIPVDRKHLFIANYVSGVVVYLIALVSEYLLCVFIAIPNHYMTVNSWKNLVVAICVNLVHFLFGFGVAICGIMLAGNVIVALAGTAVIALIYPLTVTLVQYFERYFYVTYTDCNKVKPELLSKYYWLSPVTSYATMIQRLKYQWDNSYYESSTMAYAGLIMPLVMTVIVTVVAFNFYLNRPSEAAGRAISFKKSRVFIEVPITILAGMIGAWFMSISINKYKTSWIILGAVIGVILVHGILEVVINESFKAIISHKLQFVATLVVTLLIIGLFYEDITEYDKYIPKRENIVSAGIYFNDIDNELSLLNVVDNPEAPGFYATQYMDGFENAFLNRITEKNTIDKIYGISQIGVSVVPDMISSKYNQNNGVYYTYGTKEAVDELYLDSNEAASMKEGSFNDGETSALSDEEAYKQALQWMEENGIHELEHGSGVRTTNIKICYELKNGKYVMRSYDIPMSKVVDAIDNIYKTKEFKDVHFNLEKEYKQGVIYKVEVFNGYGNKEVSVTGDEKDELIETYLSELDNLNIDIISKAPIGRMAPLVKVSELYDESFSGYYLYPEFKKTLALIESYGVDMSYFTNKINVDELVSVNLSSYNMYGVDEQNALYFDNLSYDNENDEDYLWELAPELININNIWNNQALISYKSKYDSLGVDVNANLTPIKGIQRYVAVMFKDGEIPEKIKKDIIIKLWEENQNR